MTEQVEQGSSRVAVDDEQGMLISLDADDGPELNPDGGDNFWSAVYKMPICVKYPEDATTNQLKVVQNDFARLEQSIYESNYEATSKLMNIASFIDYMLIQELVYNDFHVGENCDVTIIAGCGIHNCGTDTSKHDGVHTFYVGKNSKVRYIERHYGEGDGRGENIMNPETVVHLEENAYMEMETTQIKGIDSTNRITRGDLKDGATLEVREKIMTHGKQYAKTDFHVELNGKDSSTNIVSRSVAKGESLSLIHI